jgi:hypothetical protein
MLEYMGFDSPFRLIYFLYKYQFSIFELSSNRQSSELQLMYTSIRILLMYTYSIARATVQILECNRGSEPLINFVIDVSSNSTSLISVRRYFPLFHELLGQQLVHHLF